MINRPTLVLIGGGTVVKRSKVLSVIDASSNSLPLKKYKQAMAERGLVVDITKGRAVRSMVLCDSNHLFLSGIHCDTLRNRIEGDEE